MNEFLSPIQFLKSSILNYFEKRPSYEELKNQVVNAYSNAITLEEQIQQAESGEALNHGVVTVKSPNELRILLSISKELYYPDMTLDWINAQVVHEELHRRATKHGVKKLGLKGRVTLSYGIQFHQDVNGKVRISAIHMTNFNESVQQEQRDQLDSYSNQIPYDEKSPYDKLCNHRLNPNRLQVTTET